VHPLTQASVEFYKLEGNEYRLTPFKYPKKRMCELLAENRFYPPLVAASDLPPVGTCPMLKNTYNIKNFFMDTSLLLPNFVGRYRMRFMEYYEDELIDEINFFVDIEHFVEF
jgi:Protein of unknown function (DUF1091)